MNQEELRKRLNAIGARYAQTFLKKDDQLTPADMFIRAKYIELHKKIEFPNIYDPWIPTAKR